MQCSSVVGRRLIASASLAVLFWLPGSLASAATYTTTFGVSNDFVEPTHWSVGDADSTYQEWDYLSSVSSNSPDSPNLRGLNFSGSSYFSPGSPTLAPHAPIFGVGGNFSYGMVATSSTHNFYALDTGSAGTPPTHTGVSATIFNYGSGNPGEGTHVIVQTGMSLNSGVGVIPGTLQLVDTGTGLPILGGAAADATISQTNLYLNLHVEPPGADPQDVDYEELKFEFFLPDYFGDFRVQFDQEWSTSLDTLRIDSFIGPSFAETSGVPEPDTGLALLLAVGSFGLVRQRRFAAANKRSAF